MNITKWKYVVSDFATMFKKIGWKNQVGVCQWRMEYITLSLLKSSFLSMFLGTSPGDLRREKRDDI